MTDQLSDRPETGAGATPAGATGAGSAPVEARTARVRSRERVTAELDELYRRHLVLESGATEKYYDTRRGYLPPSEVPASADRFGIAVATVDGEVFTAGDCELPFALQSISKMFVYGLALSDHGRERVLRSVGVEPSGEAFSSLVFDENHHRPFNPMVNAGALATTNLVRGSDPEDRIGRILTVLRRFAGRDDLTVDDELFQLELRGADRNRAIAYLMRSQGMLDGDVEQCLSLYLQQCSVRVTCRDLAVMAATLANGAMNPRTGQQALPRHVVQDVLTVMYTCGMYDFAGEWAYSVGLPAKSGVSGGVLVVAPQRGGIGIFSPGLDRYGNSVRGNRVCQELSERLGLHLFAGPGEDRLFHPA
jgi:glutaminase